MSENERIKWNEYQRKRKKLIYIQTTVIIILVIASLFSSLTFYKMNKDTYVPYTQEGNAIYYAYLEDNAFYDVDHLNGSHAYVTSLIDHMTADFKYNLHMGTNDVSYKYSYRIDAQLEIRDKDADAAIFNPTYEIIPLTTKSAEGSSISIDEDIFIDYNKYNELARSFLSTYQLINTSSSLIVRMYVDVVGMSETFVADKSGEYVIELHVPLNKSTVKPYVTTTVPAEEQKILVKDESAKDVFKIIAVLSGVLALCTIIALSIYCAVTADKHIDYARKVRKLYSNYSSYIQKITNKFNSTGYQILHIDTFNQMLSLRDTLQLPILMYENEEKTCTTFFITTNEKILYHFDVSVEDEERD